MFPARYRCWGIENISAAPSGAASLSYTFKMNGIYLNGPQSNFAGAYSANVPSGMAYLLSSVSTPSAGAPYSQCTVIKQEYTIRVLTNQGAGSVNVVPFMVSSTFSTTGDYTSATISQLREQPFTTWNDVPSQTTTGPVVVRNSAFCNKVLGVSEAVYASDEDYWAPALADPTKLAFAHVFMRALDGVSNLYFFIDISIKTLYEFHALNVFSTAPPA
jgi:hypothetical protein